MKASDLVSYYNTFEDHIVYGIVLRKEVGGYVVLWFDDYKKSEGEKEADVALKIVSRC